ncbi:MAG: beta-lactamase induction protein [Rhodanobacteraceae bacterium]
MALKLLAVILVLGTLAIAPQWARFRQWRWYERWLSQLDGSAGLSWVLLAVVAPTLLAAFIALALDGLWLELLPLAFSVLVLALCLTELEPDIEAILKAPDHAARTEAARALYIDDESASVPLDPANLAEATVMAALRRRFGVLFWFFLLGPAGALLFRLAHRAWLVTRSQDDADARRIATRLAAGLDWLPAHLMVLAMALASNFDRVIHAWRAWHARPERSAWEFEPGFLASIARASVEVSDDESSQDLAPDLRTLRETNLLLRRLLVVWLALAALIVLAGWAT